MINNIRIHIAFGLFLSILSVSCDSNRKSKTEINSNTSTIDSLIAINVQVKDLDSSEIELNSMSRDYCLEIIASNNEVHSARIGEAGSKSEIYKAYECLESSFSIPELLPLLKHDSTAVRVYAYTAIIKKDSTYSQLAWNELKGKNDLVTSFSGCILMTMPIKHLINF